MAGINKDIWIAQLMEPKMAESSFLDEAQDMGDYVEFDFINLADAGPDPTVLFNNNTFPVPFPTRTDAPIAIQLDTFDTQSTTVRNLEKQQLVYDKVESIVRGHRRALYNQSLLRAAFGYSPAANTLGTPVLDCTGTLRADITRRRMTIADLIAAQRALDLIDADTNGRCMVLHPFHIEDLLIEDRNAFKDFASLPAGKVADLYGFKMYKYRQTAVYDGANVRKAIGAAAVPASDKHSSFFFVGNEVMKADGSVTVFSQLAAPNERGDIIGFQKRFRAQAIRNRFVGALVSAAT